MKFRFVTNSSDETFSLGERIAKVAQPGDVFLLTGDLGAGKTTLSSGIGFGLKVGEKVLSPTFNILKCYFKGRIPMYHIDAYRLENQNIEIGLDEYIEGDGLCLIEWPKFIEPLIPDDCLEIEIHNLGGDKRELVFSFEGSRYAYVGDLGGERLC